jgi:hypothetical protein
MFVQYHVGVLKIWIWISIFERLNMCIISHLEWSACFSSVFPPAVWKNELVNTTFFKIYPSRRCFVCQDFRHAISSSACYFDISDLKSLVIYFISLQQYVKVLTSPKLNHFPTLPSWIKNLNTTHRKSNLYSSTSENLNDTGNTILNGWVFCTNMYFFYLRLPETDRKILINYYSQGDSE